MSAQHVKLEEQLRRIADEQPDARVADLIRRACAALRDGRPADADRALDAAHRLACETVDCHCPRAA